MFFATGHLGNWELSAYSHALMCAPMGVVVRPLDNPRLDDFVERRRGLSGNHLISKRNFAGPFCRPFGAMKRWDYWSTRTWWRMPARLSTSLASRLQRHNLR